MDRRAVISRWTPRPLDLGIAAVLLVAAGLEQWLGDIGGPTWVAVLCGAVAAIAVGWRNLAPVAVAWIVAVAVVVPIFAGVPKDDGTVAVIPILFAMFALGQTSRRDPATRRRAYLAIAGTLVLAWAAGVSQEGVGEGDLFVVRSALPVEAGLAAVET